MKELLKQIRDIQEKDREKGFKPVVDIDSKPSVLESIQDPIKPAVKSPAKSSITPVITEAIKKDTKTVINNTKKMSIGQKIRKIREVKGYKQDYVCKKLKISQQSYSYIESDKVSISITRLHDISKIFDMKIEDIILFEESQIMNDYVDMKNDNIPNRIEQLYIDKIKLLEDKISYQQEIIKEFKKKKN